MANLKKIKTLCNRKNISLKDLAKEVGITEMGLQRIMKTNSTKVDTLEKIAKTLNEPVTTFLYDNGKEDGIIVDFFSSSLSKMLINRYDKISDKISALKDYYIWEFVNVILKNEIPLYPIFFDGSPKYMLDVEDKYDRWLINFVGSTDLYDEIPFSKMDNVSKETFSKHKFILDGFYFQLFNHNVLNICDYLNEDMFISNEVQEYWSKYNDILTKKKNVRM